MTITEYLVYLLICCVLLIIHCMYLIELLTINCYLDQLRIPLCQGGLAGVSLGGKGHGVKIQIICLFVFVVYRRRRLYLRFRERRFMLRQLTCGEDLDLLIDTNVAVNVSTLFGPNESGEK